MKIITITLILIIISIVVTSACQIPKDQSNMFKIKGTVYDKKYKPYGYVFFNQKRLTIYGFRLKQNIDYQIVEISGKNIKCLGKEKSYPTMYAYCQNSYCGGIDYCGTMKNKTAVKYQVFESKDVDCKKNKILNNKPVLK